MWLQSYQVIVLRIVADSYLSHSIAGRPSGEVQLTERYTITGK